jgi:hypothetical protein
MSKRTGSEVQENRETKKQKSEESTLNKNVLSDLFEEDPETGALEKPATDEEIKKLEVELGFPVPASYKQLLKFANGGSLKKNYFKLEDGNYAVIGYITGIFEDDEASVLKSKAICQELELSNYAILSGVSPEFFGLDFNSNAEDPAVVAIIEGNGLEITKLAPNLETFLCGLENKEEDALYIALKSTTPADQLEVTITTKLKEAGIEIKTEEQLLQMRAEQMQMMMDGEDTSDDGQGEGGSDGEGEGEGEGGADAGVGARTNDVRDLGDSGEESESADGDIDGGDFGGFDFAGADFGSDDEDDLTARQVTVEALLAEELPKEAALGFNCLFTFAMITERPYDELSTQIKEVLRGVEGIEQIQVVAEPVDGQKVKYTFC